MERLERAVIYTALFGDYHQRLVPLPDIGIDAVAFTDDIVKAAPGWKTVVVPFPDKTIHPRMQAKWFKLFPHELFPEYDVSIWIDAGWLTVNRNVAVEMTPFLKETNICFFPHRRNQTLLEELYETMALEKYKMLPCPSQVAAYYADGYKDENEIVECTSLLRRHNEADVKRFNAAWWKECRKWTYADQLSAPYVLWKERVNYTRYPFTLDGQSWFRIHEWRGDK
jgi:hypothetical protein